MKVTDIDGKTNTASEREATQEELDQMKLDLAEYEIAKKKEESLKLAKVALLTKLGITADEAALLLG